MQAMASAEASTATLSESAAKRPVIVVGNGRSGMSVAMNLHERAPDTPLLVFGEQSYQPYARARMASWFSVGCNRAGFSPFGEELEWQKDGVEQRYGYRVMSLDVAAKTVTDSTGQTFSYSRLVLATGSSPYHPAMPGVELGGVYTLHNIDDAMALLARQARSRHTIVVGGGVRGLEAACGMQRLGTRVTVIEQLDRLMPMQLDERGSAYLQYELVRKDVGILLGIGVAEIVGKDNVEGVRLRDGTQLPCDTVILATGVRPNIELARSAGLPFRKGILVDAHMQTADPSIYAVGECAELRDEPWGLVAPGPEQATVAVANLCGERRHYDGTARGVRMNLVGTPLLSMGSMGATAIRHYGRSYQFTNPGAGVYRKILVHRNRLVGSIGIGAWHETERVESHIGSRGWIMPWQLVRFQRSGVLWSQPSA